MPGQDQDMMLQAGIDEVNESELRIAVAHKSIQYLTIDHGLYDVDEMYFAPSLISTLLSSPPGHWNQGHINSNTTNDQLHFAKVSKTQLPQIENLWHPLQIDYFELRWEKGSGQICTKQHALD